MNKEWNMTNWLTRYVRFAQARRREIGRVTRELEGTSDRALGEIGIARGDIPAVAHSIIAINQAR